MPAQPDGPIPLHAKNDRFHEATKLVEDASSDKPRARPAARKSIHRGRAAERRPNRRGLRPLLALAPYVARYRGRAFLALVALTVAAITTLVVPIAVRRMIDFGFSAGGHRADQQLFQCHDRRCRRARAASASRYYLVMTIGERIVADLRRDVFAHLTSLSPAFFNSARAANWFRG